MVCQKALNKFLFTKMNEVEKDESVHNTFVTSLVFIGMNLDELSFPKQTGQLDNHHFKNHTVLLLC